MKRTAFQESSGCERYVSRSRERCSTGEFVRRQEVRMPFTGGLSRLRNFWALSAHNKPSHEHGLSHQHGPGIQKSQTASRHTVQRRSHGLHRIPKSRGCRSSQPGSHPPVRTRPAHAVDTRATRGACMQQAAVWSVLVSSACGARGDGRVKRSGPIILSL